MPAFEYTALNGRGRQVKGIFEADSARQVRQLLREKGLAPLTVAVSNAKKVDQSSWSQWFSPSLSVRERALVTRQIATLIAAGLPVEECLLAVSKQSENPRTQRILITVWPSTLEPFLTCSGRRWRQESRQVT
jgi:general secretion pathway protein F